MTFQSTVSKYFNRFDAFSTFWFGFRFSFYLVCKKKEMCVLWVKRKTFHAQSGLKKWYSTWFCWFPSCSHLMINKCICTCKSCAISEWMEMLFFFVRIKISLHIKSQIDESTNLCHWRRFQLTYICLHMLRIHLHGVIDVPLLLSLSIAIIVCSLCSTCAFFSCIRTTIAAKIRDYISLTISAPNFK